MLFAIAAVLFSLYPQADLEFSNLFYAGDGYFPANDWWIVKAVYHGTPWLGRLFFFIAIVATLLAIVKPAMISRRHWRRAAAVFSIVILGIGLVVHVFLKDGMGRPRPRDVQIFAGSTAYVPVFSPSDFCQKLFVRQWARSRRICFDVCWFVGYPQAASVLVFNGSHSRWTDRLGSNHARWTFFK